MKNRSKKNNPTHVAQFGGVVDTRIDESIINYETERRNELATVLNFIKKYISWLFLLFWAVDWVYCRHLVWCFLLIRIVAVFIAAIMAKLSTHSRTVASAEIWSLAVVASYGGAITSMIIMVDGAQSAYFAGLNLVCLASICFMPFRIVGLVSALSIIYLPAVGFGAFDCWIHDSRVHPFLINLAFASCMAIMSVLIAFFRSRLKRVEFDHRRDLASEVKNRAQIIEQKTGETLQLKELSRQFSPQIIEAIQSNKISISSDGGSSPTPVCALFVDIVGSTERIVKISSDNFDTVITKFLKETTRILIRHDLTIDKFLGDGILAFSGAPQATPDYVERALAAAADIVKMTQDDQVFYARHWGVDFDVRIGLAEGIANVGFYGDSGILRCYTAIGAAINLAARLCAEAAPGQVLVSGSVKGHPRSSGSFIRVARQLRLKGFETANIEAYVYNKEESDLIEEMDADFVA